MSDIRIIYHGTPLEHCSDKEQRELYNAFVTAYYTELKHDVETKPQEYAWPDKSPQAIQDCVVRMILAINRGSAANSNALRRAAKRVGLNGSMCYTRALVRQCFDAVSKTSSNETALTTIEHAISYLLESKESHSAINEACDVLYTAHKSIGPTRQGA